MRRLQVVVFGAACVSGILTMQAQTSGVAMRTTAPAKAASTAKIAGPVRMSTDASSAQLLSRAEPVYPELARNQGIAGPVELQIVIGMDGNVKHAVAVSGAKELRKAAVAAVNQWKYKPFLRNDKAIEVATKVIVSFTLEGTNN